MKLTEKEKKWIEDQIKWSASNKIETIKSSDNLEEDLGINWLDQLDIQIAIEQEFDIDISDEEGYALKTVQDIHNFIELKTK